MVKNGKIVAFIPLRGGSKSIPFKNIKEFAGKPLAFWVIEAALNCSLIDEAVVSTDSDVIKSKIGELKNNKLRMISRSEETATDTASTESAILEFAENDANFNYLVLIQATSPLLESEHLTGGIEKFFRGNYSSLLSVVRQKRFTLEEKEGEGKPINYNYFKRPRRQEFNGFLVENGAFYITSRENLLKTRCRLSGKVGVYEMPEETYFELDEPSDWIIMENLLKQRKKQ